VSSFQAICILVKEKLSKEVLERGQQGNPVSISSNLTVSQRWLSDRAIAP